MQSQLTVGHSTTRREISILSKGVDYPAFGVTWRVSITLPRTLRSLFLFKVVIVLDIKFYKDVSEKTNRGKLSKGWYEIDGVHYFVKGNTPGSFASLGKVGYEPYSEVMCSHIAEILGFPYVEYKLADARLFPEISVSRIKHVSICKSYLPVGYISYPLRRYLMLNGVQSRKDTLVFLKNSNKLDLSLLYRTLLFDAFTGNEDRHLNNIDVVISPNGEEFFAPIYDNGASLLAWRYAVELTYAGTPYLLDKARPFANSHKKQISMIPSEFFFNGLDKNLLLNRIFTDIEPILAHLPTQRRSAIRRYLTGRISYLTGGVSS